MLKQLLGGLLAMLLASFPRKGFIPAASSDYELVRTVGKQVGLLD